MEQYDILCSYGSNLCIYNLKNNKIDSISEEYDFTAAMPFYANNILFLGNFECGINDLSVYNIKEKKIIKNKEFNFYFHAERGNYIDLIKYYKKKMLLFYMVEKMKYIIAYIFMIEILI